MVDNSTVLRAPSAMTAKRADTPKTILPGMVLCSEAPVGANRPDLIGRTLDNGLGGMFPAVWSGVPASANALAIAANTIVRGAGTVTFGVLFSAVRKDYEISVQIVTPPSAAGNLYVDGRRASLSTDAAVAHAHRMEISATQARLVLRLDGANTGRAWFNYAPGDVLTLRMKGNTITLLINGEVKDTYSTASVAGPGYGGFAGAAAVTGFGVRNVLVKAA